MRESFINTITIDSTPHILRFIPHPSEPLYKISVVNIPHLPPFEMTATSEGGWRILGNADERFKLRETLIEDLIRSSN